MTFSTTQASNLASLAGAVAVLASIFGKNVDADQLTQVMGAVVVIVSAVVSFVNRYKKGDLTVLGSRK